ncbi:MAG: ABC transporter permease [Acidimicrobiales bacterium]
MATAPMDLRTTGTKVTLRTRVGEIMGYRELLVGLVRKELKVRYKNSVLGFVWSLVNPAVTIGVFYVIFSLVLKNSIPYFVLFLMSGVLVWNMFMNGVSAGVGSIVGNAPLIKKVWFPREIFPLAAVGANFVDFLIQSTVLVVAFAAIRWRIGWGYLPLIPLALIVGLLFTVTCSLWLAAVNVRFRDIQHFLTIALMVWFWGTPIIYPFQQVAHKLSPYHLSWLPLLNPYAIVCLSFQRALYNRTSVQTGVDPVTHRATMTPILPTHGELWYLGLLGIVAVVSIVLGLGAWRVFRRLEGDFAEEL